MQVLCFKPAEDFASLLLIHNKFILVEIKDFCYSYGLCSTKEGLIEFLIINLLAK